MRVTDCQKCPALVKNRKTIVNPSGQLERPDILFVGEGPGQEEDEQGRPFVGGAGHVLVTLLAAAEVPKTAVALDNAVRCRPPGNRNPYVTELRACRDFLIEDIKDINPRVIVSLGAPALQTLYGKVPIASVLGQELVQPDTGIPLIATYHPSYLIADHWGMAGLVISHIRRAYNLAQGQQAQPLDTRNYYTVTTLDELEGVRDYLLSEDVRCIGFDTETTGLSWQTSEILTLQVSGKVGEGFVIPFYRNNRQPRFKSVRIAKKRQAELLKGEAPRTGPELLWLEEGGKESIVQFPDGYEGELVLAWSLEDYPRVVELVGDILVSDKPKLAQNAAFDIRLLERSADEPVVEAATAFDFSVNNLTGDTMVESKLVDENMPSNLTVLTSRYTNLPYYEEEINKQSSFKTRMQDVENSVLDTYGAVDVDVLQRVHPILLDQINHQWGSGWLLDNVQLPMVRLVVNLQKRGILVDQDYLNRLVNHYANRREQLEQELYALFDGEQVKYGDWRNKQTLLFDRLQLPLTNAKTDSAAGCDKCGKKRDEPCRTHASTSKLPLQELYERTEHPIIPILLELASISKLESTYLAGTEGKNSGYKRWIAVDGRIHANWGLRTETGRLACEDPNLMNIPNGITVEDDDLNLQETNALRQVFIPPPGTVMGTADWSQAEVWGLAYRTGDQTLLDLLRGGQDVHVYVARMLGKMGVNTHHFPNVDVELDDVEWAMLHGEPRRKAKVFVFGTGYGLTAEGAGARLGCASEEAQPMIDGFLQILPSLPTYFSEIEELVMTPPYAVPNWAGRWRHFPQVPLLQALARSANRQWLRAKYHQAIQACIREGINFPIQSGAHELHVIAWDKLERSRAMMKRLLPVLETHDSVSSEMQAPAHDYVVQSAWMWKNMWEEIARTTPTPDGTPLNWEIPVEIGWGPSLGETHWKLTARGDLKDLRQVKGQS